MLSREKPGRQVKAGLKLAGSLALSAFFLTVLRRGLRRLRKVGGLLRHFHLGVELMKYTGFPVSF